MKNVEAVYQFLFSEWWTAFVGFYLFFALLYFGGIALGHISIKWLKNHRNYHAIQNNLKKGQIQTEIKRSLVSILVFSLQAIPLQWLISKGYVKIEFENYSAILWEIPLLFLWNEIHFYAVHWLMHRRWMMRKVHFVHHLSKEPTLYSVFSFHWVEAFLLGSVIFPPLLLHSFNFISVLSLPVMSIILNLMGHSNYEGDSDKDAESISRFSFRHSMHHKWSNGNFGFMLPFLDQIFNTNLPKNKH